MVVTSYDLTVVKGISSHSLRTTAHRNMVYHVTDSILSASPRAWISTLIFYASLISWTISAEYTFRSTTHVWIAMLFFYASTNSVVANCITTTWRWITFVNYVNFCKTKGILQVIYILRF